MANVSTNSTPTIGIFANIIQTIAAGSGNVVAGTIPVALGNASISLSTTGGSGTSCTVALAGQLAAGAGATTIDLSSFTTAGASATLAKVHGMVFYNAGSTGAATVASGGSNGFVGGAIKATTGWSVDAGSYYGQTIGTTAGATVDSTHKNVSFDNSASNGIFYWVIFGE